jgi:lauroyl/myristoyl acyltransferase
VRAAWKKFRYWLEWLALKSVATLIPLLSRNACYRLAQGIGALAAKFDQRNYRVALSNL